MIFRAEHFGVASRDPAALKEWFVRVFDAITLRQLSDSPPAYLLELPGGFWMEVYSATESSPAFDNRTAGWRHLAIQVDHLENARAEMSARGVRFEAEIKPAGGGGRVLFFSDPDGNLYHLVERPAGWAARE